MLFFLKHTPTATGWKMMWLEGDPVSRHLVLSTIPHKCLARIKYASMPEGRVH